MINIQMEELVDKTKGSVFKLCNIAAKRALELSDGAQKLIDVNFQKVTTIALEEIRQGKVKIKNGKTAQSEKG